MNQLPGTWPVGPNGQLVKNHVIPGPQPPPSIHSRLLHNFLRVFRFGTRQTDNIQTDNTPDDGGPETSKRQRIDTPRHQSGPSAQSSHRNPPHDDNYWRNLNDGGPKPYRHTPVPGHPANRLGWDKRPGQFCSNMYIKQREQERQWRNEGYEGYLHTLDRAPGPPHFRSTGELFNREEEISLPGLPDASLSPNARKAVQLDHEREVRVRRAEETRLEREKKVREAEERAERARLDAEALEIKLNAAIEAARVTKERNAAARQRQEVSQHDRPHRLRQPARPLITPLSREWTDKALGSVAIELAIDVPNPEGTPLTKHDFAKLVPANAWLNDNIIQAILASLAHYINDSAGVVFKKDPPKCVALSPLYWKYILQHGGKGSHRRLSRTWGLTKENFLQVDTLLLPINHGNHWTVIVARPSSRTLAYVDSFGGDAHAHLQTAMNFLGDVREEWRTVKYDVPRQTNSYDCGMFVVTNSIYLALGLDPNTYTQEEMPLMRRRMAAMLLHGGFRGEFDLAGL